MYDRVRSRWKPVRSDLAGALSYRGDSGTVGLVDTGCRRSGTPQSASLVVDCRRMARQPDRQLLSYLAAYHPQVSGLALAARDVVLEEAPEAVESFAKGYAVSIAFSFTGKPLKDGFCYIVTYSGHVNIGFNRGALLADPNGVLAGNGKLNRHITIRSEEDLNRPFIRRYLRAAIEQVGTLPPDTTGRSSKTGVRGRSHK